ncbi:PREDICTED: protein unc-50 homolog isoform X2 [Priapulus caudatus]|uniref:Protein unc-50 homolog isoform X2 n=1 Tax=Priapulus caudatus TaxID=37621 RepID=A0ABM1EPS6_PRICU|nr:PREDICTED: protein unc-50 homolog isoform X2 [Priapulus caudatus]
MYTKLSPPPSPIDVDAQTQMPSPVPGCNPCRSSATYKRHKYLRRLIKFRQMDFEFAFWQMLYLVIAPQKVYRNFNYRKQTKDQYARDDPAFLVLLSLCLVGSSVGFSLVLRLGFFGFVKFMLWVVFIDCIGVGLMIASIFWFLTNRYLVRPTHTGQDVEWGYCFDVHLNAFFPLLMILHVFQLIFLKHFIAVEPDWFLPKLFGNTLWLIAIGYYIYITFLGYSALPLLHKTQVLLYPTCVLVIAYVITLAVGWNISKGLMYFYEYRL